MNGRKSPKDGEACSSCDSKSCTGAGDRNDHGSLDDISDTTGYHWACALCRHPAGNLDPPSRLVSAITNITEKFELMNKVQLPRLCSDLSHLRSITERIAGQNDNILRSIQDIGESKLKGQKYSRYRKRNLTLPKAKPQLAELDTVTEDKLTRTNRQRRSVTLQDLLMVINRKLHQTSITSKHR